MMQYDRSIIRPRLHKKTVKHDHHNMIITENLTYLFRMFLISMVFVVLILSFST
ncbi:hypothetical protein GOV05_05010 [Candidatus Woesearchaeota archaeon]|nr:hypothetical protein [Candidatus Woesearchaeota archaeon]